MTNPFITSGYKGAEYFCDRTEETHRLGELIKNGNNVMLFSPRRMGKTGLIRHYFDQKSVSKEYNTFLIDIYSTGNLKEMVIAMGDAIIKQLASRREKVLKALSSLRPTMTIDIFGQPNWSFEFSEKISPEHSLEQIFSFLEKSDLPNIVAIDEFQQITNYPEKNIEATLRTYIQRSSNSRWIFSGSTRHILSEMFNSPSRPFYASTTAFELGKIPVDSYSEFSHNMFQRNGKKMENGVPEIVYERFDGVTWFMQRTMNRIFSMTDSRETCTQEFVDQAIREIVSENGAIYEDTIRHITQRQKELLFAIAKEGRVAEPTSGKFIKAYNLQSASTIQTAIKSLADKQLVTENQGVYEIYDKFLSIWLQTHV